MSTKPLTPGKRGSIVSAGVFELDDVASVYGSNKPAWHGSGIVLEGQPTSAEVEVAAPGFFFEVIKTPVRDGDFISSRHFWTIRQDLPQTDSRRYLGIVGEDYKVVNNREILNWCDDLAGQSGARFETVGTLHNGRQVYVCAIMPKGVCVKDDTLVQYLLVTTAHDGSMKWKVGWTTVRVVCANTLQMALQGLKSGYELKHTPDIKERMKKVAEALKNAQTYFKASANVLDSMSREAVNARFVKAYLEAIHPGKSSRAQKIRGEIRRLAYGDQIGGDMDALMHKGDPTAYGLFQATAEYVDHLKAVRPRNGRDADEARLDSVMFGDGAAMKGRSFRLLVDQLGMETKVKKIVAAADIN